MEVLEVNGRKLVKAAKAAKDNGYTSDYVGQLCRSGAVYAERVGRSWYVDEDELRAHRKEKKHTSKKKAKKKLSQAVSVQIKKQSEDTSVNRKRKLAVTYEDDDSPLLPELKKQKDEESDVWDGDNEDFEEVLDDDESDAQDQNEDESEVDGIENEEFGDSGELDDVEQDDSEETRDEDLDEDMLSDDEDGSEYEELEQKDAGREEDESEAVVDVPVTVHHDGRHDHQIPEVEEDGAMDIQRFVHNEVPVSELEDEAIYVRRGSEYTAAPASVRRRKERTRKQKKYPHTAKKQGSSGTAVWFLGLCILLAGLVLSATLEVQVESTEVTTNTAYRIDLDHARSVLQEVTGR